MKRTALTTIGVVLIALIGYFALRPAEPGKVTLNFTARIDGEPLNFGDYLYDNPGGPGIFKINDFRFYLSDIVLSGGGESWAEPDSYHLVRFDNEDRSFRITLNDVPLAKAETVAFAIGIDEATNTSLQIVGDLDPNNRMAWNWSVGYKFVLLEGALRNGAENGATPLVYHVGFSANRKEINLALPSPVSIRGDTAVSIDVNPMKLFNGKATVDLSALPSVKFDKESAALLAANYSTMLALSE